LFRLLKIFRPAAGAAFEEERCKKARSSHSRDIREHIQGRNRRNLPMPM
jgi:hypothetical protein